MNDPKALLLLARLENSTGNANQRVSYILEQVATILNGLQLPPDKQLAAAQLLRDSEELLKLLDTQIEHFEDLRDAIT